MIEITIKCESVDEARTYLNAQQYLNLLQDFVETVRVVKKHGTEQDIIEKVNNFYADMCHAIDHNTGPY